MRAVADSDRIRRFMRRLGPEADAETRVYFTGGATAVLLGWRRSTIDIDIRIDNSAVVLGGGENLERLSLIQKTTRIIGMHT